PVSISVILFNSRFRSYGAQGVLKKHPFCGAFLVFWGFKFLSMNRNNLIEINVRLLISPGRYKHIANRNSAVIKS
ncbi:hypothetical protein ODZ28_27285, partial [Escherichia coli]|nr:hypothetical protein [Escherichia coli]